MDNNEFLSWDGAFTAEESQFTLLPEGTYPFTITKMERKVYTGNSTKIPNGAPYAEVTCKVDGGQLGSTIVTERLYLMKSFQWKLTQFFKAIGQPVVIGQAFQPNWNTVIGSNGTAKVIQHSYISRDGQERVNNSIESFEDPQKVQGQAAQSPQQQTASVQNQQPTQQQTGFQPGAF